MSVAAGAGAAAWVVPEILMAKPAAGATMSANGATGASSANPTTSPSTTDGSGPGTGSGGTATPLQSGGTLAFTGIDIQRDAEIGAALIAGGWAMHHWASRTPKPAIEGHEAGSQVDPT